MTLLLFCGSHTETGICTTMRVVAMVDSNRKADPDSGRPWLQVSERTRTHLQTKLGKRTTALNLIYIVISNMLACGLNA